MRRGSAIWQATPSHGSWLAEFQEVLFAAVGPQLEFIVIAVLHTLDQEVALHTPGNIMGVSSRQESGRQTRKKATSRDSGPGATLHEQRSRGDVPGLREQNAATPPQQVHVSLSNGGGRYERGRW